MNIELVRHFEVDHRWKKYKNSREVELACEGYNTAGIKNTFPIKNSYKRVYISGFIRTKLTSDYLDKREIIIKDERLNELTLNPFIQTEKRLHSMVWILVWKFSWYFNLPLAKETKRDTQTRIKEFLDSIETEGENITIVGHALMFGVLVKELLRRGYKGKVKPAFFMNGEIREFIKR